MILPVRRMQRRAFTTAISMLTLIVVCALLTIVWDYAARGALRERQAALETRAEAALQSARAWTRLHPAELQSATPVSLPLDGLLPPGAVGSLELQRSREAANIEARIAIELGALHVTRSAHWPATQAAARL